MREETSSHEIRKFKGLLAPLVDKGLVLLGYKFILIDSTIAVVSLSRYLSLDPVLCTLILTILV